MHRTKQFFSQLWLHLSSKDVFYNASAITFNLLICALPFTLLITSIFGFVLSDENALAAVVNYIREFFPTFFLNASQVDSETDIDVEMLLLPLVERRTFFGYLGFAILVFASLSLFAAIKHVIFLIFEINDRRHPFKEFLYNFVSFGLAGSVFVFFSLLVSFVTLFTIDKIKVPYTDIVIELSWMYDLIALTLPVILTFALFYTFYRYVSERRITRNVALVGAATYTTLFELVKYFFGMYINYAFGTFQYLYQSYTIILMLVIWAFYGAILFIISTIVARSYYDVFVVPQKDDLITTI